MLTPPSRRGSPVFSDRRVPLRPLLRLREELEVLGETHHRLAVRRWAEICCAEMDQVLKAASWFNRRLQKLDAELQRGLDD